MAQINHNFKKKFGQNFLKSSKYPQKMVNALDLTESDVVVEIGPGAGVVTNLVLQTGAKILAIEIDYDLIPKLVKRFAENPNFSIIYADILQIDIQEELNKKNLNTTSIKVVGSLPYNISKKIIDNFITLHFDSSQNIRVAKMSFIVQDEVAKEYVSKEPDASFLGTVTKVQTTVKKLESIPASQFVPKPKVDGGIIVLEPKSSLPPNFKELRSLIRQGFASPRKTLINNLKSRKEFKILDLESFFQQLSIDLKSRASELGVEKWIELNDLVMGITTKH